MRQTILAVLALALLLPVLLAAAPSTTAALPYDFLDPHDLCATAGAPPEGGAAGASGNSNAPQHPPVDEPHCWICVVPVAAECPVPTAIVLRAELVHTTRLRWTEPQLPAPAPPALPPQPRAPPAT